MAIFERVIRRLCETLNWVAFVGIVAIMLLTTADVMGRYLFGKPITGAFDAVGLMCLTVIAAALANTQRNRGHIAVDFLVMKLRPRAKSSIIAVGYLLCFCLFSLIVWGSIMYCISLEHAGEVSQTVKIPLWPFACFMGFNLALLCVVLVLDLIKALKGAIENE